MKLLITGICGFAGSSLALALKQHAVGTQILGIDNLSRPGSQINREKLQGLGIVFYHGDIRNPSDLEALPAVDWVIDAAANPSVLAGVGGQTSSRQLIEHNLLGTAHLLEFCKRHRAGFLLLSTSRVYSAARLAELPVQAVDAGFVPVWGECSTAGVSPKGVSEQFSIQPPLSLYGAAKLASEILAFEYGAAFNFPVVVNRCGVLAGAGQFGKPDQGIFSFWLHAYKQRRPLRFIGFGGSGFQVRDCLHPRDLASLVCLQLERRQTMAEPVNVSGGVPNSISLARLSRWCATRFGAHTIATDDSRRPYDVPWLVLDSNRASELWQWQPTIRLEAILEEIALHAEQHPEWLDLSSGA